MLGAHSPAQASLNTCLDPQPSILPTFQPLIYLFTAGADPTTPFSQPPTVPITPQFSLFGLASDTLWSISCFISHTTAPCTENSLFGNTLEGLQLLGFAVCALGPGRSCLPLPGALPLFLHSGIRALGSLSWVRGLDQGHLISLQSLSLSSLSTHSSGATPV